MKPFTFDQLPSRIVFAPGALSQVGGEVQRLGAERVMLVHDGDDLEVGRRGRGATR